MKKEQKIIYYEDELNDDFFASQNIKIKKIDEKYKFVPRNVFWNISSFFWYRIVATPIAYFYLKCKFHHKFVGKEKLKLAGKSGYFLYGNHTQPTADAFIPSMISGKKRSYIIVHPSNVSLPVIGSVTHRMGALPLPNDLHTTKNFIKAVETRVNQGNAVVIYPEAHVWPYYTDIRPFDERSFRYPVQMNLPTYCFTNTYQKTKHGGVKIVTYIDGPFYTNTSLERKEQQMALRNEVYKTMKWRSKFNNVEVVKYIKKEKVEDENGMKDGKSAR